MGSKGTNGKGFLFSQLLFPLHLGTEYELRAVAENQNLND